MRLLLDEHLDRAIAGRLRSLGHEAVAVTERDDLVGASDELLLEWAMSERRVLVTRDYSTLRPLLAERAGVGRSTWGVIFVSHSLPHGRAASSALCGALEALLTEHPKDDAFVDREVWITAAVPP